MAWLALGRLIDWLIVGSFWLVISIDWLIACILLLMGKLIDWVIEWLYCIVVCYWWFDWFRQRGHIMQVINASCYLFFQFDPLFQRFASTRADYYHYFKPNRWNFALFVGSWVVPVAVIAFICTRMQVKIRRYFTGWKLESKVTVKTRTLHFPSLHGRSNSSFSTFSLLFSTEKFRQPMPSCGNPMALSEQKIRVNPAGNNRCVQVWFSPWLLTTYNYHYKAKDVEWATGLERAPLIRLWITHLQVAPSLYQSTVGTWSEPLV